MAVKIAATPSTCFAVFNRSGLAKVTNSVDRHKRQRNPVIRQNWVRSCGGFPAGSFFGEQQGSKADRHTKRSTYARRCFVAPARNREVQGPRFCRLKLPTKLRLKLTLIERKPRRDSCNEFPAQEQSFSYFVSQRKT
jgi:hypothetical protein